MSVSLSILASWGLRIASPHRIDNAVSPRLHELYYLVYRNAPRRHFGCHLPVVVFGICEILDTQRQTFENVFFIYMAAHRPFGLTERRCKDKKKIPNRQAIRRKNIKGQKGKNLAYLAFNTEYQRLKCQKHAQNLAQILLNLASFRE